MGVADLFNMICLLTLWFIYSNKNIYYKQYIIFFINKFLTSFLHIYNIARKDSRQDLCLNNFRQKNAPLSGVFSSVYFLSCCTYLLTLYTPRIVSHLNLNETKRLSENRSWNERGVSLRHDSVVPEYSDELHNPALRSTCSPARSLAIEKRRR